MRYICERYPPVRSRTVPKPLEVKVEAKPPVPATEVSPVTAEVKSETVQRDTSIAVVGSTPTSTEETPSPKKTQAAPVKPLNVSVKKITCVVCGKAVYLAEKISLNQEMNYHSACFRCSWNQCNNKLSLRNYSLFKSKLYCSAHFQQVRFESEEKIEVAETDGMKEEQKEIAEPQVPQTDETTPKPVDKWDEEREKELEMEKRMKERREQLKQGKIRPVLPFKVTPEELKNSKVFSQGIFADSKSESTDPKEPQEKNIEETESRPLSEGKTEAVLASEFESLPLV